MKILIQDNTILFNNSKIFVQDYILQRIVAYFNNETTFDSTQFSFLVDNILLENEITDNEDISKLFSSIRAGFVIEINGEPVEYKKYLSANSVSNRNKNIEHYTMYWLYEDKKYFISNINDDYFIFILKNDDLELISIQDKDKINNHFKYNTRVVSDVDYNYKTNFRITEIKNYEDYLLNKPSINNISIFNIENIKIILDKGLEYSFIVHNNLIPFKTQFYNHWVYNKNHSLIFLEPDENDGIYMIIKYYDRILIPIYSNIEKPISLQIKETLPELDVYSYEYENN